MARRARHPVLTVIVLITVFLLPVGCGFGEPGSSARGGDAPVVSSPGGGSAGDPERSGRSGGQGPITGCVDPGDVQASAPATGTSPAAGVVERAQVAPPCAPVEVPPPFTVPRAPSPGRVGAV